MELFGLKNENGKDVRLIVTDNPYTHPHPTMKVEVIEPKLEFKVGDWVNVVLNDICFIVVGIIPNMREDFLQLEQPKMEEIYYEKKANLRHATPQEIESHLRKICDEKYVGKKVHCIGFEEKIFTIKEFDFYNTEYDAMYYSALENTYLNCIYQAGRFAEIVADEPKELPKTIDELKQLILGYYYDYYKCHSVNDFLKERGYKIE